MWNDHDIFDGAGSYPPLLHKSPIMMGLFEIGQQMRLLFQHHTTPEKARTHRLFGYQGYNFLAQCGPQLALLGADERSECDDKTVHNENTWNIIFEKLDNDLQNVAHLIVLFSVPFSLWRNIPFSEQTNSVFGLPELYDDLLDEWAHEPHMTERTRALCRFQEIAEKKRTRVTFFSGDVHCCGVSRLQTRGEHMPLPSNDSKLMYQIISSVIINRPPPRIIIRAAHYFGTKWYSVVDTEERLIDSFERDPKQAMDSSLNTRVLRKQGFLVIWFWPFIDFLLILFGLDWTFNSNYKKAKSTAIQQSYNESSTISDQNNDFKQEANSLRVKFWLENTEKKKGRQPYANYDLFIPDLK
ncbi:unnamed protein product [Rotaria magnacalcarata]|nr:unnamed protein product [Rotaria magnacalcarata]CAF2243470.1 unnamed protein product [Rotaria magnacalcarata]